MSIGIAVWRCLKVVVDAQHLDYFSAEQRLFKAEIACKHVQRIDRDDVRLSQVDVSAVLTFERISNRTRGVDLGYDAMTPEAYISISLRNIPGLKLYVPDRDCTKLLQSAVH